MAVSAPLLPSAAKPPWARWEAAHPKEAEAEEEEGEGERERERLGDTRLTHHHYTHVTHNIKI
jgi:hypothetical protein